MDNHERQEDTSVFDTLVLRGVLKLNEWLPVTDALLTLADYAKKSKKFSVVSAPAIISENDFSSLSRIMVRALREVQSNQTIADSLFIVHYKGHYYLGVAARANDGSLTLSIHDARAATDANADVRQDVANMLQIAADDAQRSLSNGPIKNALIAASLNPQVTSGTRVPWSGSDCLDAVIARGLDLNKIKCEITEANDPATRRFALAKSAVNLYGSEGNRVVRGGNVVSSDLEPVATTGGGTVLNKRHKDYQKLKKQVIQEQIELDAEIAQRFNKWLQSEEGQQANNVQTDQQFEIIKRQVLGQDEEYNLSLAQTLQEDEEKNKRRSSR